MIQNQLVAFVEIAYIGMVLVSVINMKQKCQKKFLINHSLAQKILMKIIARTAR